MSALVLAARSQRKAVCRAGLALALLLSSLTWAWIALLLFAAADFPPPRLGRSPSNRSDVGIEIEGNVEIGNRELDDGNRELNDGNKRLQHIVFGIAGSAALWPARRELVRLWWEPGMRGYAWLDEEPAAGLVGDADPGLPRVRVSQGISSFRYTNVDGKPAGIRIARIVVETVKLLGNSGGGAHWLVLVDDDTLVAAHNLARVLSAFDPSELHYVGAPSESHGQNVAFSHRMAFGGGGCVLSYPLARLLAATLDNCIARYPHLAGSDDRLHACVAELGVPLTPHPGFHQLDIRGNPLGLLAAHPVAPFLSMHHVGEIAPTFPHLPRLHGLRLLASAMHDDPGNFLQQSMCYDKNRRITFSVSTGFVVQAYPELVYPATLERAERTFTAWNSKSSPRDFDVDTRPLRPGCGQAALFFLNSTVKVNNGSQTVSEYRPVVGRGSNNFCWSRMLLPSRRNSFLDLKTISVTTTPLGDGWYKVPRRQCCQIRAIQEQMLNLTISPCQLNEAIFT